MGITWWQVMIGYVSTAIKGQWKLKRLRRYWLRWIVSITQIADALLSQWLINSRLFYRNRFGPRTKWYTPTGEHRKEKNREWVNVK